MALRDYQRKRVFEAQAKAGTRLTATRRLFLAKRTINSRWWKENGLKADGVILNGTGCAAVLAGTHPAATRPPVHSGYYGQLSDLIIVPEMAVTDIEIFHALAHLVPPTTTVYIREPLHGPTFCRNLLSITADHSPVRAARLMLTMEQYKVSVESTLASAGMQTVQASAETVRRAKERDATISSLVDKLDRLRGS